MEQNSHKDLTNASPEERTKHFKETVEQIKKWLDESDGAIVFLAVPSGIQVVRICNGPKWGDLMWSMTKVFIHELMREGGEK